MIEQDEIDSSRKAYRLIFPDDFSEERVRAWLSAISGSFWIKTRLFGFKRPLVASIVLETWADDEGYVHRLLAPKEHAAFLIEQLENLVPGTVVEEDKDRPELDWTVVTEVGMSNPTRTLTINDPNVKGADFSTSLLTSIQALQEGQTAVVQWVVAPKPKEAMPVAGQAVRSDEFRVGRALAGRLDANAAEVTDRRAKLATPNYYAVGRLAVKAEPQDAEAIRKRMVNSLRQTETYSNGLVRVDKPGASTRVNSASTPSHFPAQFSTNELSAIITWPIDSPYIAGRPQSRTRYMHAGKTVPSNGPDTTVIGATNDKTKRDVGIRTEDRLQHLHVLGPTNSGKTSLMAELVEQDMRAGRGVVLIETKRDLFEAALERVPEHRKDQLIVWDLADAEFPIGFNILDQSRNSTAIGELIQMISSMFPETVTAPSVLYHGLHALSDMDGGTLIDLPALLVPTSAEEKQWRAELVRKIRNPEVKAYWEDYLSKDAAKQDVESAALRRRLWPFVTVPDIRNSLGQSKSSFQMSEVVTESKILLINLNGVVIGQSAANIMATLLLGELWKSVRESGRKDRPVMFYADEFQNFILHSDSFKEMFAQARSFGLSLNIANQHLKQLRPDVIDALANARSKIVFQTTLDDARRMAGELGGKVKPEDLLNLRRREAIAKVATPTGVSQPFTMRTKDLSAPSSNARELRERSRATYAKQRLDVVAQINTRRAPDPATQASRRRPNIGVKEWGK